MKKKTLLFVIPLFAIAVVFGSALRIGRQSQSQSQSQSLYRIALLPDRAEPNILIVTVGEFVDFASRDNRSHNLIIEKNAHEDGNHDHRQQESGAFGADEAYRVEFNQPGTWKFSDKSNPNVAATVIAYVPEVLF